MSSDSWEASSRPQRCWSSKHDQVGPGYSAAFICCSITVLSSRPSASTEPCLSTTERPEKEHCCPAPRKLWAFWETFLPLREPAAGTGPRPQGAHGETDLKTNKSNKRKCVSAEVRPWLLTSVCHLAMSHLALGKLFHHTGPPFFINEMETTISVSQQDDCED